MNQQLIDIINRNNFVILDTETTGLDNSAELCEIAVIGSAGETLVNELVKPVRSISNEAAAITGISDDTVKDAPSWNTVRDKVLEAIRGKDVIVYNAVFDRRIMHQSDKAAGLDALDYKAFSVWYCAMEAYAEFWGDYNDYRGSYRWQKLSEAVKQQNLSVANAHRALGDCLMTLALINACCAKYAESNNVTD